MELARSESSNERAIGIDILAQLGEGKRPYMKESLPFFFESLKDEKNPEVIFSILYAIGHNNEKLSEENVSQLCAFVNSENNKTRKALTFSLLGVDRKSAIDTLIILSADKRSEIRNWATFGLGSQIDRNNKKIRESLWNRINDRHQETRYEAILGLARRNASGVKEIILKELKRKNCGSLIFEAVSELKDISLLGELEKLHSIECTNPDINPDWINDLENCIESLKEI